MSTDSSNASMVKVLPDPNHTPAVRLTHQEFNRQLWRAIIPPLGLLGAHALLIAVMFLFFVRSTNASQHTERVLSALADVERLLLNMETGLRGYVITSDESFLAPYQTARPSVEPTLNSIYELVKDNPSQVELLEELKTSYIQWVTVQPTDTASEVNDPSVLTLPSTGTSELRSILEKRKSQLDRMRQTLSRMSLAESVLKSQRDELAATSTMIVVFGGISVSVILAAALALINRRTVVRLSTTYQDAVLEQLAAGKQFMDLAETIPQLIWISDGDGKQIFFNRPWTDLTGRSTADLAKSGWLDLVHPEDKPLVQRLWQQSLSSGTSFEGEYRFKQAKDGSYRWFHCRATSVTDASGKRTKWFGSCTDIENQKQVAKDRESALAAERAARNDLVRNSRAKDEFLATLSHELRTPMTAILGWAKLLRDPKVREVSFERAIEAIDTNARAQTRLIEDLLDMSRINVGKLVLKSELVDMVAVVRAAIDSVSPAATNRNVMIDLSFPENVPVQLKGDAARLQQVVWNLLTNAVKFTPIGGNVDIKVSQNDDFVKVEVIDAGKGIAPEFLPHVFQRFRQEDGSTTRTHGGLGLGLAIVQQLVEMHGGAVSAASEGPGRGAIFTVEIPRNRTVTAPISNVTEDQPEVLSGRQVLLVDDDIDSLTVLRLILENAGCQVTTASGAHQALALLQVMSFDVLVSDIGMPHMDGYALVRRLRELESDGRHKIPAIALTAFARAEDRAAALSAGFQQHIVKPITPDDLIRAIASLSASKTSTFK